MDDPGEREGIGTWKCFDHAVYALPNPGWQLVQHPGFPVYQIVAKKCQMASSIFVSKSYITLRVYVQNMYKHATVPYGEHYQTCKINRDICFGVLPQATNNAPIRPRVFPMRSCRWYIYNQYFVHIQLHYRVHYITVLSTTYLYTQQLPKY